MWKESSSIQKKILWNMFVIVLTAIGLWSIIWIQDEYSDFRVEAELIRMEYIEDQKKILKTEVNNVVKYIKTMRESAEQEFKNRIKERVYLSHQIASNIYNQNISIKSPAEIGELIKDALRVIRFDDGRCSYFIGSMDGTEHMYPVMPEIESVNLIDTKDSQGNYVVRDEIKIIKEAGEGFVRNSRVKSGGDPAIQFSQIRFVKYFKPMDWYFGTGYYLEDFEVAVRKEALNRLVKLRFGTNGYFFGGTFEGKPLFSNGKINRGSGSILETTDFNGIKLIQEQMKACKNPDGGFLYDSFKKTDTSTPHPKISFVKGIPEWQWMIGAGVYIETIEKSISKKEAVLYAGLKKRISRSLLVLATLLCLTYFWSKSISNQIQGTIETFLIFLRRASSDSLTINPEAFQLKEFRVVAMNMLRDRKQAEKALSESEETYRNLFQNAQVGLFRTRIKDGKFLESNEQLAKMFGFTDRDEFIAECVTFQKYALSRTHGKILEEIKEKGKIENLEVQFCRKNGSVFWVRFSAIILREKGFIEGVAEDVTEQKIAEEALRESEEQYRLLADNATDNIWILQLSDMRMLYSSPSVERLLGYTSEQFLTLTLSDYISPKSIEEITESIAEELKKENDGDVDLQRSVFIQIELMKSDKTKIWAEVKGTFLRDKNGRVDRVLGITRDITERKSAEEEKITAQKIAAEHEKLALVGQIAGKLAHDFNNILGVIMGNAEISLLGCQDDEIRNALGLIFDQTIRGKNLTKNLVAFAKDQEPRQEYFRINEKVDLVVNLLKKDLAEIELVKEYNEEIPDVLADPGMIEHALVNLLQNSIHALSMVSRPVITIRTYCQNDNIFFEIEDNGCGIPDEYLGDVYAPSFTLKGSKDITNSYKSDIKGTGYGMANVEKYIGQHQGDILLETKFGSGTKFTINLPIKKKELISNEKAEICIPNEHVKRNILIVEDEISISNVQGMILAEKPCHHNVDIAKNGQNAIDFFDRNEYDVVSLDYILPGDINGMDIYDHIRKTDKTIPILFISGNIEFLESIKELKQKDNYTDYLSKPCQNKDYINSLNNLMDKAI